MANALNATFVAKLALPLAALALSSCGSEEAEPTYEAGVTDEGGGELIVTEADEPRIEDQTLPETPMTPVPVEEEAAATDAPAPEPAE